MNYRRPNQSETVQAYNQKSNTSSYRGSGITVAAPILYNHSGSATLIATA
ncbi:hypothetical protein Cflav_PD2456 [Pedosphaera parvula Ellin514]|uniref:Uncharacterized protein n=1 Tax=Pedosphaera parvula (strain Ellin514) TaxID=320771 RepID=B9XKQ6_PEDPL|nr:hypothetical protein Cflav_PD2456 [Pedosphaera parvula Ellin514]